MDCENNYFLSYQYLQTLFYSFVNKANNYALFSLYTTLLISFTSPPLPPIHTHTHTDILHLPPSPPNTHTHTLTSFTSPPPPPNTHTH